MKTVPRFGAGVDLMIEAVSSMPKLQLHRLSCTQQPMTSPPKLADNVWFHSLLVPKIGWLWMFYQGCIRAMRKKLREIQPDIVHRVGTEREGAISAVFSGFPKVVAIAGNMAELARRSRAHRQLRLAGRAFGKFHSAADGRARRVKAADTIR